MTRFRSSTIRPRYWTQTPKSKYFNSTREFFKKEVVNKDMGKFYKKWLITTPIRKVMGYCYLKLDICSRYLQEKHSKTGDFIYIKSTDLTGVEKP